MTASFITSSPDVSKCPTLTLPEYAFIGRSNVGKSSLINALTHNPKLAKTSQKPGKTLLINLFQIESFSDSGLSAQRSFSDSGLSAQRSFSDSGLSAQRSFSAAVFQRSGRSTKWTLVDLPGYGFAQTGKEQREKLRKMIEGYCLRREPLVSLFVLIDSRLAPQPIDLEFMQWLGENQVPFAIVFTKSDKLGKGRLSANLAAYKQTLLSTWEELPPIFVTSAETGFGTDELLSYIESLNVSL